MIAFLFLYLGMASLGLAVEAMITVLTPRFVPFFLFFMVRLSLFPSFHCMLIWEARRSYSTSRRQSSPWSSCIRSIGTAWVSPSRTCTSSSLSLPPSLPLSLSLPFPTNTATRTRSQAIRTLIFNVHSDLGRNAGVLIAWIILSCITTVLFTIWLRSYELDALLLLNPPARKVEEGSGSGSVSVDGDGDGEVGKGV